MNEKHTEYTVVVESNFHSLKVAVGELIKKGWQCQGGVAVYVDSCYQAMVR